MRHLLRRFKIEFLLILGVFLAFLAPILLTRSAIFSSLNFTGTGQIGDTIGGIAGPILNFVGLILLYYSFREQFKANQIQISALQAEQSINKNSRAFELLNNLINQFKDELEKIPKISESFFGYSKGRYRNEFSLPSINLMNLLLFGEKIIEKIWKADLDVEDKNSLISMFYFHFYYKLNPIFFEFENQLHLYDGEDLGGEGRKPIDDVLFRIKSKLDEIYSKSDGLKEFQPPFDLTEKVDPEELNRPYIAVI